MALKDIFNMAKAARYTQDGRDQITEALENETEDVRYKPGDISQKTGLQKQPDGSWAEPKRGAPAGAKQTAKKEPSKNGTGEPTPEAKKEIALRKEAATGDPEKRKALFAYQANKASDEEIEMVLSAKERGVNHPADFVAEFEKEKARRSGSAPEFGKGSGTESDPDKEGSIAWYANQAKKPKFETEQENSQYARGKEGWDTVDPARLPDIKKKVEQKLEAYKKYDPYAMLGKKTGLTETQKKSVELNKAQNRENIAFYTGQLEAINERLNSKDSAPRQLTGDCKIKIKKS